MDHFLLEFGVRALLVSAGTAVVLRAARVRAASTRHAAWTGVLVVMLLLPVWTVWGPKVPLMLLPAANTVAIVPRPVSPLSPAAETTGTPAEAAIVVPSRPESKSWSLRHVAIAIYVFVTAVLLFRLLLGTLRAQLLVRRATLCDGLLTSTSCASPLTVGWFRPIAILPEEWHRWPQGQLDAVLTHEYEHARRHDPLVQWLALLNRAVFWFHPLSWWLERQLSALAEEACDAAVLAKGHSAQDYSEYLLRMADSVMRAGRRVSLVGMAMPGSFLPRRIPRLFEDRGASRISRTRLACATAALAVLSAAFVGIVLEARESEAITVSPIATKQIVDPTARVRFTVSPTKVAATAHPVPTPAPMQVEGTSPSASLVLSAAQEPILAPQATPAPQQVQIDARMVVADRSFTREVPSMAVTRNMSLGGNFPLEESGLLLVMQPGSESQLDEILATGENGGSVRTTSRPELLAVSVGTTTAIVLEAQIPVQTTENGSVVTRLVTFPLVLQITPEITHVGLIHLKLSVKRPDFSGSVNGVSAVSRSLTNTVFVVKDGATAMISVGLRTLTVADTRTRQVPGLGELPIIGSLFQRTNAQLVPPSDSDLLIFITPKIKTP